MQKVHERKFHRVCHICAKVYSTNAAFKRHLQEHSGVEQPRVNCHVCGNSYKNDIVLKTHMILHEDEGKKFPCPHCSKMPPNRLALKSHIYEMHKFKLRKCNFCEKGCKTNQELRVGGKRSHIAEPFRLTINTFIDFFSYRNTLQRTPENIYTIASIVRKNLNPIPVDPNTINGVIRPNGKPINRQIHEPTRK